MFTLRQRRTHPEWFGRAFAISMSLNYAGNPVGSVPGNYVEADGNPSFESGFNYQLHGLTAGQTYTLSFYQGASTQEGFGFNPVVGMNTGTTNQWIVSLGSAALTYTINNNTNVATYHAAAGATTIASQVMTRLDSRVNLAPRDSLAAVAGIVLAGVAGAPPLSGSEHSSSAASRRRALSP